MARKSRVEGARTREGGIPLSRFVCLSSSQGQVTIASTSTEEPSFLQTSVLSYMSAMLLLGGVVVTWCIVGRKREAQTKLSLLVRDA